MEKKSLKTYKTWAIVLAVVTMVLGLVMVFWPGISAVAICYLMGAVCIAAGIYEIIRYFDLGLIGVLFRYDLFLGIMSVLAGVLLLLHPNGALVILPVILGFYIILASVFSIQISTEARHFGFSGWWGALLLGIAGAVFGVLMIFDPFKGAKALMIFTGISLLVTGVESIYAIVCISKAVSYTHLDVYKRQDMENSLSKMRPHLVSEWSEKNSPLTPVPVTFGLSLIHI